MPRSVDHALPDNQFDVDYEYIDPNDLGLTVTDLNLKFSIMTILVQLKFSSHLQQNF